MSFTRTGWTTDPLEKGDVASGDYFGQLQNNLSYRREVAELGIPEWENAEAGIDFQLEHIDELKESLEEPGLLRFYGYTEISDVLGRRWSDLPRNVDKEQDLGGYEIINDMRTVVDNLTRPLYVTDDGDGWVIRTRIKDSGDAAGWKRFDGDPDYINSFDYIVHDTGPNDFLYMTDSTSGREVHRFRMNGSGRASNSNFVEPYGIDYDVSGDFLYVVDRTSIDSTRIVKTRMDDSGREVYEIPDVNNNDPEGLSYDPTTGYIYLADRGFHRIIKTLFGGGGFTTFGTEGSGVNQFDLPYGIHYDSASGFMYVADTNNNRIVKTKFGGVGWTTLGTDGAGENQFSSPRGIYYEAATDLIYVTDTGNDRIVRTKIDGSEWRAYYGFDGLEFGSGSQLRDITM